MRTLALLLLAALLLSGCSEGTGGPPAADLPGKSRDPGTDVAGAANTTVLADPVLIDEGGDITGAFSKEWTWKTGSNVTRFDVNLDLAGPKDAPSGAIGGVHAILVGTNGTAAERGGSSGTISINIGGGSCFLCYDGVRDPAPPGEWRLMVESETALATYDLHVEVDY